MMRFALRLLALSLCASVFSFGAIIDNFSLTQTPGAIDTTPGAGNISSVYPGYLFLGPSQRTLNAYLDPGESGSATALVDLGTFFGMAVGERGFLASRYQVQGATPWDLSQPGLAFAVDVVAMTGSGSVYFGLREVGDTFDVWSPAQAITGPGTYYAVLSAFNGDVVLNNVLRATFIARLDAGATAQLDNFRIETTPEPSTYALMAAGLLGLFGIRRKKV